MRVIVDHARGKPAGAVTLTQSYIRLFPESNQEINDLYELIRKGLKPTNIEIINNVNASDFFHVLISLEKPKE